jgi:hypothetical protein
LVDCWGLVSFPIFEILLAALAPPNRISKIVSISFYDVNVSAVDDLLAGCDVSTVTAREPHRGIYSTLSKDRWHRILLSEPANELTPVFIAA